MYRSAGPRVRLAQGGEDEVLVLCGDGLLVRQNDSTNADHNGRHEDRRDHGYGRQLEAVGEFLMVRTQTLLLSRIVSVFNTSGPGPQVTERCPLTKKATPVGAASPAGT